MKKTSNKEKNEKKVEVIPFINGETIFLTPPRSEWVEKYIQWFNDPKIRKYLRNPFPSILEDFKKWIESEDPRGIKREIIFTIYHEKDDIPIGIMGLERISWFDKHARMFIIVGEPKYWDKNITIESGRLILKYGFEELNLHKIYIEIFSLDENLKETIEEMGFKRELTLKEEVFMDGKYLDCERFAIFDNEWMNEKKIS